MCALCIALQGCLCIDGYMQRCKAAAVGARQLQHIVPHASVCQNMHAHVRSIVSKYEARLLHACRDTLERRLPIYDANA